MLIVGEEEEKTEPFLSVATDRKEKGNISVTIEEFEGDRGRRKDAHRINNLIRGASTSCR
jgi:hypothetical protein